MRRSPRRSRPLLLGTALMILAGAAGLLVVGVIGARATTRSGSEHSLGVAAAPVIVEEWSDFQ